MLQPPLTASLWDETFPVVNAFDERILQTGVGSAQITLLAFLVTFLTVRTITHLIKAGKGPFGNVSVGGTHIHHLVPGIFLLLISGALGISWNPDLPTSLAWIIPTLFGIGAALTLDEFALWLTLRDVYWEREGRRSVDAVVVAGSLLALIALGLPFWADVISNANSVGSWTIIGFHTLSLILAVVCFLKGKWIFAALGILMMPFAIIGAIRLARPTSHWARRLYGVRKTTAAVARYPQDRHAMTWPWQRPHAPDGNDPVGSDTTD